MKQWYASVDTIEMAEKFIEFPFTTPMSRTYYTLVQMTQEGSLLVDRYTVSSTRSFYSPAGVLRPVIEPAEASGWNSTVLRVTEPVLGFEDAVSKTLTHCIFNTTAECSLKQPYFRTEWCSEKCPAYVPQRFETASQMTFQKVADAPVEVVSKTGVVFVKIPFQAPTVLPYFITWDENNQPLDVWIKVSGIPSGSILVMPSSSASPDSGIFEYFTDFSSLSGWTVSGTSNVTYDASTRTLTVGTSNYLYTDMPFDLSQNYGVYSYGRCTSTNVYGVPIPASVTSGGVFASGNAQAHALIAPWNVLYAATGASSSYDIAQDTTSSVAISLNVWYEGELIIRPDGFRVAIESGGSRQVRWDYSGVTWQKSLVSVLLGWLDATGTGQYKWLCVVKANPDIASWQVTDNGDGTYRIDFSGSPEYIVIPASQLGVTDVNAGLKISLLS